MRKKVTLHVLITRESRFEIFGRRAFDNTSAYINGNFISNFE